MSALHWSARFGHTAAAEALVKAGADLGRKDGVSGAVSVLGKKRPYEWGMDDWVFVWGSGGIVLFSS